MSGVTEILAGSIVLSTIHALIPNHWLPIVTISKVENWSNQRIFLVTAIIAFAHILSTIIIGILVGLLGYKLSSEYEFYTKIAAPLILVSIGLFYLILEFKKKKHSYDHNHNHSHDHGHSHGHSHNHNDLISIVSTNKSFFAIIASLAISSFFTPCIELEAYYFTAGIFGWPGIAMVSFIYAGVTILGTILLVFLGIKGFKNIKFKILEEHERSFIGGVLIILGIAIYLGFLS